MPEFQRKPPATISAACSRSGFSTNRATRCTPSRTVAPGWMYPNPGSGRDGTMPTVTSARSWRANRAALASVARYASTSPMAQSACTQIITASPSARCEITFAAQASAAQVPAGRGSAITFSGGNPGSSASTASRSEAFVSTSVCDSGANDRIRSSVSHSMGESLISGSSCFGRSGVDSGQKRDPTPPARTTFQRFMARSVMARRAPEGNRSMPARPASFRYVREPAPAGAAD